GVNMASPQRPDPDEPRRSYDDVERDRLARDRMNGRTVGTGTGFAWWWVFWIVIIALAIWWAGWGWGGSGGWWWGGRGRTAPYGTTGTPPGTGNGMAGNSNAGQAVISGPGLSALTATNKQPYIGKPFQVNDVPVQNQVNDHVFWIGAHNSTPMLVVLTGNDNTAANAQIGQGTLVNVTGTMQKAPPLAQAQQQWQLSGDDAAQLERQGVFIQATQVHTIQP
ncbi:MAG: hypothetical protein ACRD25_10655, partial [Terracidiphilus sp.]